MAYTDATFYKNEFYGDILPNLTLIKWLEMASDEVDAITHGRLQKAFPKDDFHAKKVKKAVCAVAEILFQIDEQTKASLVQKQEDGTSRSGIVTSISSGKESISFSSSSSSSAIALAVSDVSKRQQLIVDTAVKYLANVPDANGVNLLYGGV